MHGHQHAVKPPIDGRGRASERSAPTPAAARALPEPRPARCPRLPRLSTARAPRPAREGQRPSGIPPVARRTRTRPGAPWSQLGHPNAAPAGPRIRKVVQLTGKRSRWQGHRRRGRPQGTGPRQPRARRHCRWQQRAQPPAQTFRIPQGPRASPVGPAAARLPWREGCGVRLRSAPALQKGQRAWRPGPTSPRGPRFGRPKPRWQRWKRRRGQQRQSLKEQQQEH